MIDDKKNLAATLSKNLARLVEDARLADLEHRESIADSIEADGDVRDAQARHVRALLDVDVRAHVLGRVTEERDAAARQLHELICPGCHEGNPRAPATTPHN